jgi:dTDP-4-amino-4,6-dideoxygalactose transaminase
MYTLLLDRPARPVVDALGAAGIIARPIWRPMFELPAMRGSHAWGDLPHTRHTCTHAISLPCSVDLAPDDQQRVIDTLKALLNG